MCEGNDQRRTDQRSAAELIGERSVRGFLRSDQMREIGSSAVGRAHQTKGRGGRPDLPPIKTASLGVKAMSYGRSQWRSSSAVPMLQSTLQGCCPTQTGTLVACES